MYTCKGKTTFWYHYNKPASRKAGRNKLTVHYGGLCHIVDGIDINVRTYSRDRKTQPRCVIAGIANHLSIKNGIFICH